MSKTVARTSAEKPPAVLATLPPIPTLKMDTAMTDTGLPHKGYSESKEQEPSGRQ
jgi:hypothetical protein